MKHRLFLMLVCLLTFGVIGVSADPLRVGARTTIPGFGYCHSETGIWSGMEIDLARQLAADLGYDSVSFVPVDPTDRETVLEEDTVDCVIAIYSDTPERRERVHFSAPYYTDGTRLLTERSTLFTEAAALQGKVVGVLESTSAAFALESAMPDGGIAISTFQSYDEMIYALETGTIDAACADGCILSAYITRDRLLLPDILMEEAYSVATRLDSPLSERVDTLIERYRTDGTLETIIRRWNLSDDYSGTHEEEYAHE